MSIIERIRARVKVNETTGCWEWQGSCCSDGYGNIWIGQRCRGVHRVAYEAVNGEIPEGQNVLHECDNPPCCNPCHLFLGTQLDNIRDRDRKRRTSKGSSRPTAKLKEDDIPAIVARLNSGETQKSIALDYGVSYIQIGEIRRGKSWRHVQTEPIAARTTTKLSDNDVREIRIRVANGERRRLVAADYGVGRAAIDMIVNRQTWKNVT